MTNDPNSDHLAQGTLLADKYEIVRVIGQGGMGVVYEAKHMRLGHRVAIKTITSQAGASVEMVKRFEREARAAAQLSSPYVARINDVENMADGTPFIVMEYLEGNDLDAELEERGHLPIPEAVDYILQACSAMSEAHDYGIIHRDLKPGNLFLAKKGAQRRIKVLDFGISKVAPEGEVRVTATTSSLGTPMYMSPEQIRSAKHVDGRSDVWALGVILYELIAGLPPFKGESATAVIAAITADTPQPLRNWEPDVPLALEKAVMQSLNKNPDERFADIASFAEMITPFGSGTWMSATASHPGISNPAISIHPRSSSPSLSSAKTQDVSSTTRAWEAPPQPAKSQLPLLGVLGVGLLAVLGLALWLAASGEGEAENDPASTSAAVTPSAPAAVAASGSVATPPPAVEPSAERQPAPAASTASKPASTPHPPATQPKISAAPKPAAKPAPKPQPKPAPKPEPKPRNPVHL